MYISYLYPSERILLFNSHRSIQLQTFQANNIYLWAYKTYGNLNFLKLFLTIFWYFSMTLFV